MTVEEIKRGLKPGKKTNCFLEFPARTEVENLIPDDYDHDSFQAKFNPEFGADRARAVFDNSRLTGKTR